MDRRRRPPTLKSGAFSVAQVPPAELPQPACRRRHHPDSGAPAWPPTTGRGYHPKFCRSSGAENGHPDHDLRWEIHTNISLAIHHCLVGEHPFKKDSEAGHFALGSFSQSSACWEVLEASRRFHVQCATRTLVDTVPIRVHTGGCRTPNVLPAQVNPIGI